MLCSLNTNSAIKTNPIQEMGVGVNLFLSFIWNFLHVRMYQHHKTYLVTLYLKFSWQWLSSGIWHCVVWWKFTDISKEHMPPFSGLKSKPSRHRITSQETVFFSCVAIFKNIYNLPFLTMGSIHTTCFYFSEQMGHYRFICWWYIVYLSFRNINTWMILYSSEQLHWSLIPAMYRLILKINFSSVFLCINW
jgi:hypothetical protein